ncbi:zinc-ribbon domain-containing protein [Streptosporangium sp. NPDC000509]|uniref:zinc-ribbon domain-containing protein n=1 Tax=Streptosporangium sp. NPDC000509 TaxID=3366186 RepID=UPI0036B0830D
MDKISSKAACLECGGVNQAAKRHPLCVSCRRDLVADEFLINIDHPSKSWSDMMPGCGDVCQWRCRTCGNKWPSKMSARTSANQGGCPKCFDERNGLPLPGKSIAELNPEISRQFRRNLERPNRGPEQLRAKSKYLCEWECGNGHFWEAIVSDRTAGNGCPKCTTRGKSRLEYGVAELVRSASRMRVALHHKVQLTNGRYREVDLFLPDIPLLIDLDPSPGHGTPDAIQRDKRKTIALMESGYKIIRIRHHGLPSLGIPADCQVETPYSSNPRSWATTIGQELQRQGFSWRHLSSQEINAALERSNAAWTELCGSPPSPSALDIAPHLEEEFIRNVDSPGRNLAWMPPGSEDVCRWKCRYCGYEWDAAVDKRVKRGQGCPPCGAVRQAASVVRPAAGQSLAELEPDLARELIEVIGHPEKTAWDIKPGSGIPCRWRCSAKGCGHEWLKTPNARTRKNVREGCPPCSVKRRAALRSRPKPGQSLADLYPAVAKELVEVIDHPELTAWDLMPGSGKTCLWECSAKGCDQKWPATPDSRTGRKTGCPSWRNH